MRKVMTIAGSDSGGCAGIQADLKTFAANGVFGTSALTSITAQNTLGVKSVYNLPVEIISQQIDAILEDIGADVVKTGMLATAEIIGIVSEKMQEYNIELLVVDPVMVSTSGDSLLEENALKNLRERLLPLAAVVTPNMKEAELLSGSKVESLEEMRKSAKIIHSMGPKNVIVKGGHLEGDVVDILYDGKRISYYLGKRIVTENTHGTGCTFASAVAAYMALGFSVKDAIMKAKYYMNGALKYSKNIGKGSGPVNHLWRILK